MPDSNPRLTASLHGTREVLLREREEIARQFMELRARLETNSTEIEATDTLMRRFNPDHISLDVRTDLDATPLLHVTRSLGVSTSPEALKISKDDRLSDETPSDKSSGNKTKSKTNLKKPSKAKAVADTKAQTEDPTDRASRRSPAQNAIAEYFKNSPRNETILKILKTKKVPVSTSEIAEDYRALFPLPEELPGMKSLHNGRISAALSYLRQRGQAERVADELPDGRAENIRWKLSKSYRTQLRKTKSGPRPSASTAPISDTSPSTEEATTTTH
jgi:hypothetical protein